MAVLCRWILVLPLLLAGALRLWAATPADLAFQAAVRAFQDTFYARAEGQLADFCQKYPDSPRFADAVLLQAQARIKLTNYVGATDLLTAYQTKAGKSADQYLFWLGKAYQGRGDWPAASEVFARLVKEQPGSSLCLDATICEAEARSALARTQPAEWQRVMALLQETNGVFQSVARTNAASEVVPLGYLLLSEAQLAAKNYGAAEATLQPLAKRPLSPRLAWQCQYLLGRIQLADRRTNAALQTTTNLLAIAANAAQTNLLAESAAFRADLLEALGQTNEAIVAYQQNLAEGIPPERQRQALLKIAQWSLAQDKVTQATQMLERFLRQYPEASSADLALLTLGELRLRQSDVVTATNQVPTATTNAPAVTNDLQLATASFITLIKRFPQSPLVGKAQLDLGWCYWRGGKLPEAQAAFSAAVERLPVSNDLATAYFRFADTQVQQTNFTGAIKSYQAIIEKFATVPEVRTNLFEPALYQIVRTGLEGGELASANLALQNLLAWYPGSLTTARAVLLTAQDLARRGDPPAARKMLLDFDHAVPNAPLRPQRQLAVAATWEQDKKWVEAIAQ